MKNQKKIRGVAVGAVVAALYVVLTYLANMLGLASGAIQVRLSEILTVMPVFTPFAIPGLFIGCVLANVLTGCALWDVVFGSLATLIGAIGTYALRKYNLFLFYILEIRDFELRWSNSGRLRLEHFFNAKI